MSSNKIQFHLMLSEKEIPNFINTKIHDSDNRTILGIVKEYDAEKCLAVVDLTEEGAKIIKANLSPPQPKIGWSVSGSYLPPKETNIISISSQKN